MVTKAAVLYMESINEQYKSGDTFLAEVRLDTEEEHINAVQASLVFSPETLEVQDLSIENSVLSLWVVEPFLLSNTISFIGGVPHGYNGPDGLLATITFRILSAETPSWISFQDNTKTLLNDGKGTEANLRTQEAVFNDAAKDLELSKLKVDLIKFLRLVFYYDNRKKKI